MSSLDWSCYLCLFKTKDIDQLKIHVNSEHNPDSKKSDISTTNNQNKKKSDCSFIAKKTPITGTSKKHLVEQTKSNTKFVKSSKPKPNSLKENVTMNQKKALLPIFDLNFEDIFETTTVFYKIQSDDETDREITFGSKSQKTLTTEDKNGKVSKSKSVESKELSWNEICDTIDLNFDDIFQSCSNVNTSSSQSNSNDDQTSTVDCNSTFIKEETDEGCDLKIVNVCGNYSPIESDPEISSLKGEKRRLNRLKLDKKLKSAKRPKHQMKPNKNDIQQTDKVKQKSVASDDKTTELSRLQTLISEKSNLSAFFDFSAQCPHCSYVTDTQVGLKQHVMRRHALQYRSGWTFKPVQKDQNQIENRSKHIPEIVSNSKNNIRKEPKTVSESSDLPNNQLTQDSNNTFNSIQVETDPLDKSSPIRIKFSKTTKCSKDKIEKETKQKLANDLRQKLAFVRVNGFNCDHCSFLSTDIILIKNHIMREHKKKKQGSQILPKSSDCFTEKHSLNGEIKASRGEKRKIDELEESSKSSREVLNNNQRFGKSPHLEKTRSTHSCNTCQKEFETDRLLSSHKKSYHVVSGIKEKQTYRGTSIKYLKYFKHEDNYECSICQKSLASNYSLQRHTRTTHEKKFKKSFKSDIETKLSQAKKTISKEFEFLEEMKQNDFLNLFSLKMQSV